jgi:hypothetical protein
MQTGWALRAADIKALDQAIFNLKHVTDHPIREKISVEVPHHLMDFDNHFAFGALGERDRLHVRIDHRPLPRPVLAHFIASMDMTAFHGFAGTRAKRRLCWGRYCFSRNWFAAP